MARWERVVCVLSILYILGYSIFFFTVVWNSGPVEEPTVLPLHFLGMALSFALLAVILRDIYKRPFRGPNAKVTWALLVVFANIFAIPFYLWKYGFTPRQPPREVMCRVPSNTSLQRTRSASLRSPLSSKLLDRHAQE